MRKFLKSCKKYKVIYKYLQFKFGAVEQNLKSRKKGKPSDTEQNVVVLNIKSL